MMIFHVHTCIQQDLHQVQASGDVVVAPVGATREVRWRDRHLFDRICSSNETTIRVFNGKCPSAMTNYSTH
jgi:hypothetical protein